VHFVITKTFQRAKAITNYRMHDLKLPLFTIGVTLNNHHQSSSSSSIFVY